MPSFTRNWLARRAEGRMPISFGRFDALAIAMGSIALAIWTVVPTGTIAAVALCLAGRLHLLQLAPWAGERTLSDRLVLILRVAYAFVPICYFITALSALDLTAMSAGVHAWTGGAIGTMTIAVMTRASLARADLLLPIAGAAWTLAFLGFATAYGPLLVSSRKV